jgi:hypothetical protein
VKKIILGFLIIFLFLGCSATAEEKNITPTLVVGRSLSDMQINDQFGKAHTIDSDTKRLIFAFSKATAHICNDYFKTKPATYLAQHKTQFIADVSAAPYLIKKMFILPGLKDFKHTVLVLDDEVTASKYNAGVDVERIVIVDLNDRTIINVSSVRTIKELIAKIEEK